ncbi:uncharacterized protein LOC135827461 [Sycon ciliatum]|uniref:uncharacterized protein LOC135827461 n=1 Tax=Sycon ciliatum TaxID=27933 RepID=UPI0031F6C58D
MDFNDEWYTRDRNAPFDPMGGPSAVARKKQKGNHGNNRYLDPEDDDCYADLYGDDVPKGDGVVDMMIRMNAPLRLVTHEAVKRDMMRHLHYFNNMEALKSLAASRRNLDKLQKWQPKPTVLAQLKGFTIEQTLEMCRAVARSELREIEAEVKRVQRQREPGKRCDNSKRCMPHMGQFPPWQITGISPWKPGVPDGTPKDIAQQLKRKEEEKRLAKRKNWMNEEPSDIKYSIWRTKHRKKTCHCTDLPESFDPSGPSPATYKPRKVEARIPAPLPYIHRHAKHPEMLQFQQKQEQHPWVRDKQIYRT